MNGELESAPEQVHSTSPVPAWDLPPDAPKITYNWVDITEHMKQACEGLELGELIHEPHFGLFDAMSAIEMMDPKMDSGMVGKQTKRKVLSFAEAIAEKTVKVSDLTNEELVGIFDQSLCCLLSWLDGQTLAQTVFTCLYLHDTNLIEDRCLRAFSLCMLKVCDIIRMKVNRANVFEEEDFQTMSYGFKFADNLTDMRVIGMMKEMEEEYGRKYRNLKAKVSDGVESTKSEATLCNAVLVRIKFVKLFLQALTVFGKKEGGSMQPSKKHLNLMLEHVLVIGNTVDLGIEAVCSNDGYNIVHGFEPLINQKLLPPTFPRYTALMTKDAIKESFTDLIKRLITVTQVTSINGFQNILNFIDDFGRSIPCVLSRSLLQSTLLPENRKLFGQQPFIDCIKESIKAFSSPQIFSPRCPTLQSSEEAKICSDVLLNKATRVAISLVQAYGHNRARHRERLGAILEDFAALQEESERADAQLQEILLSKNPAAENPHVTGFSGWATYYTLKVMMQYLSSGFELELYSPHEMHYIYWYLSEVLYAWSTTIINRAEIGIARDEALADIQAKGKNSKKTKKNKKKTRVHVQELREMQGCQNMASGMFKAMLGFFVAKKIALPNFFLDSECTRYEHRFLPFVNINTPPFMMYSQFRELTDLSHYQPPPTAEQLYFASSKHFANAKLFYETLHNPSEQMQSLCKVAKTNLVVMKLLATGHRNDSTSKIEFDFSVNEYFPIFKIT